MIMVFDCVHACTITQCTPPPNTLQFTLNSDSFNILPLGATDAHNHTSLQEDYVGKPWVKVLWHEL